MESLRQALEVDPPPSSVAHLLLRPDVLSQLKGNPFPAWIMLIEALKRARDEEGARAELVLQVLHLLPPSS